MATREAWATPEEAPLHQEHLLLGGSFDEGGLLLGPTHYPTTRDGDPTGAEGCLLCDLSGMVALLVGGAGSDAFLDAACAAAPLAVGECAFGAVATGDGSLAGIPLVGRSGDAEYLLWDPSSRGLGLMPWLSFLASIEQGGFRPFGGVTVEDVSGALVPLLLWGSHATAVLADYVADVAQLPAAGTVASVSLDRIPCLVAAPDLGEPDKGCYLVLAPERSARVLWRSLLSFTSLSPVGTSTLRSYAKARLPWAGVLRSTARLEPSLAQLDAWGVARPGGGFVGARALRG